jgi:hypothetical protein
MCGATENTGAHAGTQAPLHPARHRRFNQPSPKGRFAIQTPGPCESGRPQTDFSDVLIFSPEIRIYSRVLS